MMNMMNMMKQAQNIQKRLKETQDELNKMDISGEAANGAVKVICDGKGLFKSIKLSPEAINPENPSSVSGDTIEMLEDIITARLLDSYEKEFLPDIEPDNIKSNTQIPTNQWVRLTYTGLTENETYTFNTEAVSYNETNDISKVQNNYKIGIVFCQMQIHNLHGEYCVKNLYKMLQDTMSRRIKIPAA